MLANDIKEVAMNIGQYYLQKNNGDYKKTEQDIVNLGITKIEVDPATWERPATVSITVGRPGLFIGKRGTNIDALEKYLKIKVKIIEDTERLIDWLVPTADCTYDDEQWPEEPPYDGPYDDYYDPFDHDLRPW